MNKSNVALFKKEGGLVKKKFVKKKKVTKRVMMPIIATVAVCACTVAGFSTMKYLQGNPYKLTNENGETYISYMSKADIVDNIYEKGGDFVILEIVPYEDAGIMEMLVGTDNVRAKLEANKEALFNVFKDTAVVDGTDTIVTVGGSVASYHPFNIRYNSETNEYTLSYPNNFISSLVDAGEERALYNYLLENVEVRTVVASELTEEDLKDVSLIYVSSYVQDAEVVNFNRLIDGDISASSLNAISGIERIGLYEKVGGSYKELTIKDASTAWYDSYIKDAEGNYISNDMDWDMVETVMEYIYAGNEYTDGQPIPSIINYGTPVNKSANIYKLMNLMIKTSNEENAEFNGMSTYYKNVMEAVKDGVYTYDGVEYSEWNNSNIPLFDIRCFVDKNYVSNFTYVMQGAVDDMLFSIGSIDSFMYEVKDNGSASVRDVAADGDNTYTSRDAVEYLLNGGGKVETAYDSSYKAGRKRAVSENEKVKVLEIQPCQDFLYEFIDYNVNSKDNVVASIKELANALGYDSEYAGLTKSNYQTFLNKKKDKIEFTCVTPQEFNGMNDDMIASYDIVIIGTRTGQMNTKDNKTIWNDNELDGYIYLAYGDLVKGRNQLLGCLPRDYVTLSSLGTINNWNGFKNEEYGLLSTLDWRATKHVYTMKNKYIWTPLLLNTLGSIDANAYWVFNPIKSYSTRDAYYADSHGNTRATGNDITKLKMEEMMEYLSVNRPVILADDLYNSIEDDTKVAYPTSNMYKFTKNSVAKEHVIKYSEIGEKLTAVVNDNALEIIECVMQYEEGDVRKLAPEIKYRTDGSNLLDKDCIVKDVEQFYYKVTFKAKPGTRYSVKALVDKDTDGRFESEATIDDFNEVYYSRKLVAESDEVTVELNIKLAERYNGMFGWKILVEELGTGDVRVDAVSKQNFTVVTGETKYVKALQISTSNPTLNMNSGSRFTSLMKDATEVINYNVTVDYITADDFENLFAGKNKAYRKGTDYNNKDTGRDQLKLKGYNMLILGFEDCWGKEDITNEWGAMDCILDYIENGNSVLMSHDVILFYNNPNYAVTVKNKKVDYLVSEKKNYGGAMIVALKLRALIGQDQYNISTIPDMNDDTLAKNNVPMKADGTYIQEIQGYTNWHVYRYNQTQNYSSTKKNYEIRTLAPWKGAESYMPTNTATLESTIVNEVNRGQISMYPFKTTTEGGTLNIAYTHPQYYKVNLEDEDLVVWYTIGATLNASGNYVNQNQFYRDSGKDAANNYYIYSKGNITYSGAGDSDMTVDTELQLFVNTVIRAALAGNFVPEIKIINGATTKEPDNFVMFPSSLDEEIKIEFVAFDEDLATRDIVKDSFNSEEEIKEHIGRFTSGEIYYMTSSGDKLVLKEYSRTNKENYLLNGEITSITIYNPFDGKEGAELTNAINNADEYTRNMYEVYNDYMTNGSVDIYIEASDHDGATGKGSVTIVQHELFELD